MAFAQSILIVEDEGVVALDLKILLEGSGHRVVGIAPTAERALLLADQTRPTLCVVDVKLAGPISGLTVANELKRLHDIRVVVVTGNPQLAVDENWHLGNVVLSKPFAEDDLLQAVAG